MNENCYVSQFGKRQWENTKQLNKYIFIKKNMGFRQSLNHLDLDTEELN